MCERIIANFVDIFFNYPLRMKRSSFIILFLVTTLSSACNRTSTPSESIWEVLPLTPNHTISLEIDSGDVIIVGGGAEVLQIEGELLDPEQVTYSITSSAEQMNITFKTKRRSLSGFSALPAHLKLLVPDGVTVRVKTFDAAVTVRDFHGDLQISSVSGNLLAEKVAGTISLVSGRGDISVKNATGQLRVLGEHGVLNLENVSGTIGSSTIMGTIRYLGRPIHGDEIRIEVDHGPVEISLPPDSNLDVIISSTSGELACIVPGLRSTGRNCLGTIGIGGASMTIRTVSGSVTLQVNPLIP